MNTRTIILFLTLILLSVTHVSAEDATAEDRALLEKLRADDYDERIAARTKLLQRGEAIRDLITAELARPDLDADYKTNLKVLTTGLAELDILNTFDHPRRADFDFKDETVDAALKKISETFGQTVTARDGAGKTVITLSLKHNTYFEAIDAVRSVAGLAYYPRVPEVAAGDYDPATERFKNVTLAEPTDGVHNVVSVNGPFALVLSQLEINDLRNEPSSAMRPETLQGSLYFNQNIRMTKAKINSVKVQDGNTEYDLLDFTALRKNHRGGDSYLSFIQPPKPSIAPFVLKFYTAFISPANLTIASNLKWKLKLAVEIELESSEESLELDAQKFNSPQTLKMGIVTIHSLEKGDRGWELECAIPRDVYAGKLAHARYLPPIRDEYTQLAYGGSIPDIHILDDTGRRIIWSRFGGKIERTSGGVAYNITMIVSTKPKTLVFRRPIKSVQREFEFEFPSVPIPLNKAMEK